MYRRIREGLTSREGEKANVCPYIENRIYRTFYFAQTIAVSEHDFRKGHQYSLLLRKINVHVLAIQSNSVWKLKRSGKQ
jgi:hypothetical protein